MGYSLIIGNANVVMFPEEGTISFNINLESNEDSPSVCGYTGKSNHRMPSYSGWSDFCKNADIEELFFGKRGWRPEMRSYDYCSPDFHREYPLLYKHPGTFLLTKGDVEYLTLKRAAYERKHGVSFEDRKKDIDYDRLLWLEFWVKWAVENCQFPAIQNS